MTPDLNVVWKSVDTERHQRFQFVKTNHSGQKVINAGVHLCEPGKTNFREKVENGKIKDQGRRNPHH